jgi:integrase
MKHKLSDIFIRQLKPTGKVKKYSDGDGLYLHLTPQGNKLWRMCYRFKGKQKLLSFGVYPYVSLRDAREKCYQAKGLLYRGIDPSEHKKAVAAAQRAKFENSFEVIAREWFIHHTSQLAKAYDIKIRSLFERQIFPVIGSMPIIDIEATDILKAARHVEDTGSVETAHRLVQLCGQVFRYAIATGRVKHNVAADLRGALKTTTKKHMASLTNKKRIGELLRDIDAYTGYYPVKCALQLAPYVFVRPGELIKAQWAEIDFDSAEWRIPGGQKGRLKVKSQPVHIVPLSKQSLFILESLHPYTGHCSYLFPSIRSNTTHISDMTLLAALRRLGYDKEEMTVHGFRSIASTILNEQGYNFDWIERQLAHGERNAVRAAYNYADYLPQRRTMMQEYADYLDKLRLCR